MLLELDRYDWAELEAAQSLQRIRDVFAQTLAAQSFEEASTINAMEFSIYPSGGLYESAVPFLRCLVISLPLAPPIAKSEILDCIADILTANNAIDSIAKFNIKEKCCQLISRNIESVLGYLHCGNARQKSACIHILYVCSKYDSEVRKDALYYFERVAQDNQIDVDVRNDAIRKLRSLQEQRTHGH